MNTTHYSFGPCSSSSSLHPLKRECGAGDDDGDVDDDDAVNTGSLKLCLCLYNVWLKKDPLNVGF